MSQSATSAACTFFDPITVGNSTFFDGGTSANNPVDEVWCASMDAWPAKEQGNLKDNLKCFVSIGISVPPLKPFGDDVFGILYTLKEIATDTERKARNFLQQHSDLEEESRYFD